MAGAPRPNNLDDSWLRAGLEREPCTTVSTPTRRRFATTSSATTAPVPRAALSASTYQIPVADSIGVGGETRFTGTIDKVVIDLKFFHESRPGRRISMAIIDISKKRSSMFRSRCGRGGRRGTTPNSRAPAVAPPPPCRSGPRSSVWATGEDPRTSALASLRAVGLPVCWR